MKSQTRNRNKLKNRNRRMKRNKWLLNRYGTFQGYSYIMQNTMVVVGGDGGWAAAVEKD